MSRHSHLITAVIVLFAIALPPEPIFAQQKRTPYGPVVRAYLTGLDEERNELEFQLRHKEISRADYERAKHRLTILRGSVERYASERREDIVPEYQVLAEDELSTLGLSKEFRPEDLIDGMELEGQWKIIEIRFGGERKLNRFLVLEGLSRARTESSAGIAGESRVGKTIDPRDVIETIVVREKTWPVAPPQQTPTGAGNSVDVKSEASLPAAQKSRLQSPRILRLYWPEYTEKARDKKVEGEVVVRAMLQRDGRIRDAKVEKGLGFGLDERAVEATKRIGFSPAQLDGKEVDAQVRIVFSFKLEKVSVYVGEAELAADAKGERF